ncbi:MAG: thaumatin family protein [Methanospirillaceae archaeon]|nr:thaumatin family protein [Methanospirillaceae archaeon]
MFFAAGIYADKPLSYTPVLLPGSGENTSSSDFFLPESEPCQFLENNGTIVIGSSNAEEAEYTEHIVTVVNEHETETVWINLFAGPFGTFADGYECHPTDCSGSECCPSVRCEKAKCGDTICNTGEIPLPYDGGFVLGPGESKDVTVKVTKERITTGSGNLKLWARTGCKPTGDPDYPIVCDTANCDMDYAVHSRVECGGLGSRLPATVAEITFNGAFGLDSYDISLVDGWNVPMFLEPISGNYNRTNEPNKCTCSGGFRDLAPLAEQEIPKMVYKVDEKPAAVWSACAYSRIVEQNPNDAYCCTGEFHDAKKCQDNAGNWPADYKTASFFQNYYPKAYAFAYGDPTGGNFVCGPNDNNPIHYKLTIYGKDRNQASYVNETVVTLTPGEPVLMNHPEPGVQIRLESESSGIHEVHLTIIPSHVSPEYPGDYEVTIPTLGNIYQIQSTIPKETLSGMELFISYSDEDYRKAGYLEESLSIMRYEKEESRWTEQDGKIDIKNNTVSGHFNSFGYFTISGTKTDQDQGNITVSPGWNLISTPKTLTGGHDNATIFAGIDSAGHSILSYDPESYQWIVLAADSPVNPLFGYWVYSHNTTFIPLFFEQEPNSVPERYLARGWNLIGFSGSDPVSAHDTLISIQEAWIYSIGFNASVQQYETAIVNGGIGEFSDCRLMYPTRGYWNYMNQSGTLVGTER